jgi:hypothetical protein
MLAAATTQRVGAPLLPVWKRGSRAPTREILLSPFGSSGRDLPSRTNFLDSTNNASVLVACRAALGVLRRGNSLGPVSRRNDGDLSGVDGFLHRELREF